MRVFITGASSGIGEALARQYGGTGAELGLLARRADVLESIAADFGRDLPFLIEVEEAASLMVRAIEARKKTYTLPWQMNLLRHVLSNAPEWLVRRVAPPPHQRSTS